MVNFSELVILLLSGQADTVLLPNGDFDASGMNSLNHYSFGSVGTWLYQYVAGIRPAAPGYKKICFKPMLTQGITWVKAAQETVYGTAKLAWRCEKGQITVDVTVPANTTARLCLPEQEDVLDLLPGTYHYEYPTDTRLEPGKYSSASLFADLLDSAETAEVVYHVMPELKGSPMLGFIRTKTIGEMEALSGGNAPNLQELVKKLNLL